ncbi:MAG TPA: YceI family protein [Acidimicrobiales bacterium]|nr:YceI family protein [Acidimicrobiales bacterium]
MSETQTLQAQQLTRQFKDTVVPHPGVYDIDPKHSSVEFVARHLMITKVRGRLNDVSGSIQIAEVPEESSVEVTIGAASVHTGEEQRDSHLRSGDFFDVETHPTWTFKSTSVEHAGDNAWKVTGDLTIRGTTRQVVLDTEFDGANQTPWGSNAIGFSAATEIDREDFGLTYNMVLETGGVMMGKKVRIELNVEAVSHQAEDAQAS